MWVVYCWIHVCERAAERGDSLMKGGWSPTYLDKIAQFQLTNIFHMGGKYQV